MIRSETIVILFLLANIYGIVYGSIVSTGDFNKDFFITWSPNNVYTSADGHYRTLKLDQSSGSSFASNDFFLFGEIDMQIKLIPGHSAGTVVAFYLTSDQPNRDEIDFEFLGNATGQPYILQTNIYVDGFDNREERIYLWFDPTEDFHTYSILWNLHQVVFMVDWVPIRVFRNHADKGASFPRWQPMSLKASLWNGDSWATRGGHDKVDWSKGPFIASFRNYKIDACIWKGNPRFCRAASSTNWWNKPRFSSLTYMQRRLHRWIRRCSCFSSYSPYSLQIASDSDRSCNAIADLDWDKLGFGVVETDYMYVMKCSFGEYFQHGELNRYSNLELRPSAGVLNYGQGLYEGLKAYRKKDGEGYLLFRPQENAFRMQLGAERMCMPSPTIEQFVNAVKQTVKANKRWVPPQAKGSLYMRPLLIGSGPVLGLAPAPEYTFLVYASPVGLYFKEGLSPINLLLQDEFHRSCPGGTGGIKAISNYAPVLKAQIKAKNEGFADVLYVDSVNNQYLEEGSACNIFIIKKNVIATPITRGTILNGVTRRSIIEVAHDHGYQVEERLVSIEDLMDADEVFCTGTAVIVAPVASITFHGQRFRYKTGAETLSQFLYKSLTDIQMGLVEDKKGWTVEIK